MPHNLQATSSLEEWLSYLEHSHFKTIDLGLERVKTVAEELGLLQPAPYVITVGGTNGKGTTCRLLERILLNAGLQVGVYSSPHLLRYNERVRIQNQELPDEAHTASFAFIERHKTQSLTYFEFGTLSALYLFKKAGLDVVILEVGLGGRLDATNIIDADLAVITSIDIDHVAFLGDTREKIAFEKAGIFRADRPVVIGEPDIPQSMLDYANALNCPLSCRDQQWHYHQNVHDWSWTDGKICFAHLPLCNIPLQNAATALAAVQQLPFAISERVIRDALQQVELSGRFETLKPARLTRLANNLNRTAESLPHIIVDVGHNPHAARYLAEKLTVLKAGLQGNIIAVCGILRDKDAQGVLTPLLPLIDQWHCVTLTGERGQSGKQLFVTLQQLAQDGQRKLQGQSEDSVAAGVKAAVSNATAQDLVLIFGSFHTVAGLLQML